MNKIIFLFIILALTGCAKKEWSKQALVNDCLKDFTARNEKEKLFDPAKIPYLCNCISEKMVTKYKSEKESSKDKEGATQIGRDCAMEVLQK